MPTIGVDYQPGGSLPPEATSYVVRQADQELFAAVRQGTYCYVLNSRQMGKSSLRVRTAERLYLAGIQCIEIELLGIGSQEITAMQWYGGIIQELIRGLRLQVNRRQWLQEHEDLSPVQRLGTFVDEVVLPQLSQPLVIFFDEIDSLLGLNFATDEFFGLIRSWYERRAIKPDYARLTVVMLGVATPSELIQDARATPFNMGQAIELSGFQIHECQGLAAGLAPYADNPVALLSTILDWTGGQPFLTQKLCFLVAKQQQDYTTEKLTNQNSIPAGKEASYIEQMVRSHLIQDWEAQDEPEHLRTIRNRILRNASSPAQLLRLYQTLLRRGSLPIHDSDEQRELRLSGLVTRRAGQLQPFNRIYRTIFNRNWVSQQLKQLSTPSAPTPVLDPSLATGQPLKLWQVLACSVVAIALVITGQALGVFQPLELKTYDTLLRLRPKEPVDNRFLIITVDEADIQYQDQQGMERKGSISDEAILQVLQKLTPYQPRVIGLDFFHDFEFTPALTQQLQKTPQFLAICAISDTVGVANPVSIPPPIGIEQEQIGFADFVVDSDYRVRRQLLAMDRTEVCPANLSFNFQIALRYLAGESLSPKLENGQIQIGDRTFPKLSFSAGGYHARNDIDQGYQLLINYRHLDPRHVSLTDLLKGEIDETLADWASDRIVLIGLADPKDSHFTPMQSQSTKMFGVIAHAHMASQIISAVLDHRLLIREVPQGLEYLWIGSWSWVSAVLYGAVQRCLIQPQSTAQHRFWKRVKRYGIPLFPMVCLTGCCYGLLLWGWWYPLSPAAAGMLLSHAGLSLVLRRRPMPLTGTPLER